MHDDQVASSMLEGDNIDAGEGQDDLKDDLFDMAQEARKNTELFSTINSKKDG